MPQVAFDDYFSASGIGMSLGTIAVGLVLAWAYLHRPGAATGDLAAGTAQVKGYPSEGLPGEGLTWAGPARAGRRV